MKILPINSNQNFSNIKPYNHIAFKSSGINKSGSCDTVDFKGSDIYDRALSKLQNITKEEYAGLTEEEKAVLRAKLYDNSIPGLANVKEDVDIHQYAAEAVRQVFDKEFGRNNYVVIAAGRSLSSISKLLEMKIGKENVKNIPMSNMQRFFTNAEKYDDYSSVIENYKNPPQFDEFKRYLDQVGLSREQINNSGKKYIIMDYESSGASLDAAYTVLTDDCLLGNEKRNVYSVSINDLLSCIPMQDKLGELCENLDHSRYKKYSFVNQYNLGRSNINEAADYSILCKNKHSLDTLKLFGFALLDSEFSYNRHSGYLFDVKNAKSNIIPIRDKKIWFSTDEQYYHDLRDDAKEVYKLMRRINTPLEKFILIRKKLDQKIISDGRKKELEIKDLFNSKYSSEYQYYLVQKRFDEISEYLGTSDLKKHLPIMDKSVCGFDKNSELYKLFEETDMKIKAILEPEVTFGKEMDGLIKAKKHLLYFEQGIKSYRKGSKDIDEHKQRREDYYIKFRPRLLMILDNINKNYSVEKCMEYSSNINDICDEVMKKYLIKNDQIIDELKNKAEIINAYNNQEELNNLVKVQNEELKKALDEMLPF